MPEQEPAYIPQRPLPAFARKSAPPSSPPPPPRASTHDAPSVAPLALDVAVAIEPRRRPPPTADSTMQIILNLTRVLKPVPKRRLGWVVALAVGASVLILVAGFARRALSAEDDDARASLASMVAPPKPVITAPIPVVPTSTSTSSSTASPSPSPASLAPSPVGTVLGPAGRVYIDGKQVRGTSAIVPCGSHAIRVAPVKKAKPLDVPCGGEVKVK
jgi:hypothetical protein